MSNKYYFSQSSFRDIPGAILCYWLSERVIEHLKKDETIADRGTARQGLSTSDNNRFLRYWHEVVFGDINFICKNTLEAKDSGNKWFPYNKAGSFRRWSSIDLYVVNYGNDGKEIKETVMKKYPYLRNPDFVVKNTDFYFRKGISWNDVSTELFCCRFVDNGYIFADASPMLFSNDDYLLLGYANSCVFQLFADVICQGLHYSTGQIPQIPFIMPDKKTGEEIQALVIDSYETSKKEWDSYETSWCFKRHPLV